MQATMPDERLQWLRRSDTAAWPPHRPRCRRLVDDDQLPMTPFLGCSGSHLVRHVATVVPAAQADNAGTGADAPHAPGTQAVGPETAAAAALPPIDP